MRNRILTENEINGKLLAKLKWAWETSTISIINEKWYWVPIQLATIRRAPLSLGFKNSQITPKNTTSPILIWNKIITIKYNLNVQEHNIKEELHTTAFMSMIHGMTMIRVSNSDNWINCPMTVKFASSWYFRSIDFDIIFTHLQVVEKSDYFYRSEK